MANNYISLQGELFLAKRISGIAGAYRSIGNMPKLGIKVKVDKSEHFESTTGHRTKDHVLYKQIGLEISGELEEVTKENLALIMSGSIIEVPASKVDNLNLGAVKTGNLINLGQRNLSTVVFKDDKDAVVSAENYSLDSTFGTVTFNKDFTSIKWSANVGAKTRTNIANQVGKSEYAALFKGVDTVTGDKVSLELWRLEFSPETEFDLIHHEYGKYSISGNALSDAGKGNDAELSIFGTIERFTI